MLDRKGHWEEIYTRKEPDQHSWYQGRPDISLALIAASGVGPDAAIIDVGGGASTLTDALLQQNYSKITILDISIAALARARYRLEDQADRVHWVNADITTFQTQERFALWHDRAVFHFLTDAQDQARYRNTLFTCLSAAGHLILATFALDGPTKCSNLDVMRHDQESLQAIFGDTMVLLDSRNEWHVTPTGKEQKFLYCHFQRC